MKIKIVLILVLSCAVFASLIVGTLSNYTTAYSTDISITPDKEKIQKYVKDQVDQPQIQFHIE